MSPCFPHWEIFFSSGPIWSDSTRFKFPLSPNTFEGKQDQAQLKCEGETSSFAPSFPHLPWYPAAPALTRIGYVTYLWRASSATFLLPLFSLPRTMKLFANPWASVLFHNFLPSPTLILLAAVPWWKLQAIPIHLSWSGSSISPWSLPFSASLQGSVVHSFFCVTIIVCTYLFYKLYDTTFIHISISLKNNKLWLWVRHCDKCREQPMVREIQVSPVSYNLHPIVITVWFAMFPHSSHGKSGSFTCSSFFFLVSTKHRTGIQ